MKKLVLILIFIPGLAILCRAQCDKKVIYTGSKAIMMDSAGKSLDSIVEKIVVETSKGTVKLMHGGQETDALNGKVNEFSCQWKEAFKNGISQIKASLSENNGTNYDGIITIEAKDSRIVITLRLNDPSEGFKMFRIPIDSYMEE
jgi:hypothetical protein